MKQLFGILAVLPLSMLVLSQSVTVRQSSPTNQNLTPQQQAAVVRLSNLQKNFGKSSMNSPGVTLSLKEINRRRITDRTLVTYELYATGMPKDHIFTIFEVKISGQFDKLLEGVTLDSDGQAICASRKGTCSGGAPNSPIDLVFFAGKAEPKRLALVSEDGQFKGALAIEPFPNATTDKGCRLESIIGAPKGEITYIQGSGFEPNEELTTDGESYGEKNHFVSKAEADGSFFATTMPNVLGKASGITTFEVKGKNCDPKLSFSWGTYQLE
jgi:hypothetical protein